MQGFEAEVMASTPLTHEDLANLRPVFEVSHVSLLLLKFFEFVRSCTTNES